MAKKVNRELNLGFKNLLRSTIKLNGNIRLVSNFIALNYFIEKDDLSQLIFEMFSEVYDCF